MLISANSIFYPVIVTGALIAGGIHNSANPAYPAREISHQLIDTDPLFVLAAENYLKRVLKAVDVIDFDRSRVFLFSDLPMDYEKEIPISPSQGQVQYGSALVAKPEAGRGFTWEDLNTEELSDRTTILIYSSGTTGLPKGVELSRRKHASTQIDSIVRPHIHRQTKSLRYPNVSCPRIVLLYLHGVGMGHPGIPDGTLQFAGYVEPHSELQDHRIGARSADVGYNGKAPTSTRWHY